MVVSTLTQSQSCPTFGVHLWDHVLRETARLVSSHVREQDVFARWGGEEFMILVPNNDLEHASMLAGKLRGIVEGFDFGDNLKVTASFGVAQFREKDSVATLTNRVDEALYQAKRNGRNRVEVL
jgi:diguanylate cyclase (GGDEF)-like protein